MKTLRLIPLLLMIGFATYGQQQNRKFGLVEYRDNGDSLVIKKLKTVVIAPKAGMKATLTTTLDSARLYIPNDGKQYVLEGTWKEKRPVVFDTVYMIQEVIEPTSGRVLHVNMNTVSNSPKNDISDKSFSRVTSVNAASSSTVEVTGQVIELWAERFAGHGQIQIYIDNVLVTTIDQGKAPFETDIKRGKPSFRKKLTPGSHKFSVRAISGQHIIDNFTISTIKLEPRL